MKRQIKKFLELRLKFARKNLNPLRILGLFILALVIIIVSFIVYLMTGQAPAVEKIEWGVTFSQPFAEKLELDWQKTYLAILDDLGVRKLRLIAYWPDIEPERDKYNFDDLDWQIEEAAKRGAEVILVMGQKVPRWPECHIPDWASGLTEQKQQAEILSLLNKTVRRYRDNKTIKYWQVENEPFLRGFGECPKLDEKFLDREIDMVMKLDRRPVIMTTSGELSFWGEPASRTTILGTTLYRIIWSSHFGAVHYPITPVFYYKRAQLTKYLFSLDKVFVVELQAEPWRPKQIYETPVGRQFQSMNLNEFKKTIEYFKKTGMDEAYLWGVEWWYWLKTVEYDSYIWTEAKKLWRQ